VAKGGSFSQGGEGVGITRAGERPTLIRLMDLWDHKNQMRNRGTIRLSLKRPRSLKSLWGGSSIGVRYEPSNWG